jgi:hypothetical protein
MHVRQFEMQAKAKYTEPESKKKDESNHSFQVLVQLANT